MISHMQDTEAALRRRPDRLESVCRQEEERLSEVESAAFRRYVVAEGWK
jgi:hypothetical protein